MKLIQKGFATGTGRTTTLLRNALSGDKNIYKFFITNELTLNDVTQKIEYNKLPVEDYPKFRIIYNVKDAINTIREIILALEGIPSNEPVEIYVDIHELLNFNEFKEVENLTIYHYLQTNKESVVNCRIKKLEDILIGHEYMMSFKVDIRRSRIGKVIEINSDNVILFDGNLSFRVTQDDIDNKFIMLDRL